MLNQSVAFIDSFSFFAASMRCATYPPPPGSAPGYQVAHHCTASGTMKIPAATDQSEKSGRNRIACRSSGLATSPASPPTSGCCRAKYAAAIDPIMATAKSTRSVTTTPQSPEVAE